MPVGTTTGVGCVPDFGDGVPLYVSVPDGMEDIAEAEFEEKAPSCVIVFKAPGKLFFEAPDLGLEMVHTIHSLRSCEHLYVYIGVIQGVPLEDDAGLANADDSFFTHVGRTLQLDSPLAALKKLCNITKEDSNLTFRVTGTRSCGTLGRSHCYSSPHFSGRLGGGVKDSQGWLVNLNDQDVEISASLVDQELLVGFVIAQESMARDVVRGSVVKFSRTTTRSAVAYGMCKMARLAPGDIVLDPMAGVFTIPIEASLMQPGLCLLGGDLVEDPASMVTNTSVISFASGYGPPPPFGMQRWGSERLPLRDGSVDVIICDMPFGVKCGSKSRNQKLYPKTFANMCRVLRVGGRAVILSTEVRLMYIAASQARKFKLIEDRNVSLGTMHFAHVLVLERVAENIEEGSLRCPVEGSRRKRRGVLDKPNGEECHKRQLYRHLLKRAGAHPKIDL